MNVNALGGTHRPSRITPPVGGAGATRPVGRSDESGDATVAEHAVDTASDRRAERMQHRAQKFESRLDHLIEHKLAKVDAKIDRFIERHDLSNDAVNAIAEYRAQFEATLSDLRATLTDGGYEPGAVAAFRDAAKEALGTLRESVRSVLEGDFSVAGDPVADGEGVTEGEPGEVLAGDGAASTAAAGAGAGEAGEEEPVATSGQAAGTPAEASATITISAELVSGLQEVRDAIDIFLESVAVDDAFDASEVLLPTPAVDIQA